jgi:carboxypeptidase T
MGLSFVRIRADNLEQLRNLQQVYALDVFSHTAGQLITGFEVQGLLTEEQIEQLRENGYEVEIIRDAESVAKERLKEVGPKPDID